ncbi:MAG TPA: glycosyltransferase family 9 protein [Burkholderiales bacterium]|nr:glycosyltransferase family 9 protein [Burkholderiales bacterium]
MTASTPPSPAGRGPRFLVIRRDNIGDLVCTTPLLRALRERYPAGHIAALVNTYNRAVLDGNPDVDAVYAYEKGKHRGAGRSVLSNYGDRLRLILALRREKFDYAILATPGFAALSLRLARLAGARHVLGYADPGGAHPRLDIALAYDSASKAHEVEQVFGLLKALGIGGAPSATRVFPDVFLRAETEQALARLGRGLVVGVHISARRKNQQWPEESFAALIRATSQRHGARILLLWSPGEADNPMHPGDDGKANAIVDRCAGLPLLPWPTAKLAGLIAALSVCDYVVCADGGAMHLAAALARPILCFFGDSPPERWRPWMTPHELLRPDSRDLRDLSTADALAGFERLVRSAPSRSRA